MSSKKTTPPLRGTPPKEWNNSPSPKGWQAKPDGVVPRLRFPEFRNDGEWGGNSMQDVFVFRQGLQVAVENQFLENEEDRERFIRIIDVTQSNEPPRFITVTKDANIVSSEDLFMIRYGTPGVVAIGYKGIIANNLFQLIFKNEKNHFPLFWYHYLQTKHEEISGLSGSSSMPAISFKTLNHVKVKYPTLSEQQRIASCLSSLDALITAETQNLEALKTHKRGLQQQLFPREGETQPRLRFPEFQNDGEWKATSFGALGLDVSDGNYSSKYPSQSDFVANGVPFLRANNLKFGTVTDDDMRFISKEQHSQITKGHLTQGDILITTRGELGTVALVPDRHIGSNINAQIVRINTGNKLINTFLFQLLDYSRVIGLFDALSTGTALKQLPIGKLNQLALRIPEIGKEQQLIADCLSSLDALITAETQKLEALKRHKRGLMQQLFPSVGGVAGEA